MRQVLADSASRLYWSAASSWEAAIKHALDRLPLPEEPSSYVPARLTHYNIHPLPIRDAHAFAAGRLPLHHKDPFDRMLVAQAQVEGLAIVSADPWFQAYGVRMIS